MKVRDICGVVEDIYDVYDRVVYYEDVREYGAKYLGEFSEVKDSIMDYEVCKIYPHNNEWVDIEVMSNNILHTKAKIINYSGECINSPKFNFENNLLSRLVCKNSDVNYIYYVAVYCPKKNSDGKFYTMDYYCNELLGELPKFESNATNGKHGKFILAFYYYDFFDDIWREKNENALRLKNYMISNGWVFDSDIDLVYKIIVL